jgi:hypothetical protein
MMVVVVRFLLVLVQRGGGRESVAADAEETTETNFNGYTVVNMSSLGQNDGLKRSQRLLNGCFD